MSVWAIFWRGGAWLERGRQSASRAESFVAKRIAATVDAFTPQALKLRARRTLRALRLEARPSPAEWGASVALGVLGLVTPLAAWLVFDRLVRVAPADGALTLALLMAGTLAFAVVETALRYARVHLGDRSERLRETLRAARTLSRLAASPLDGALEDGAPARAARLEAAAAFTELRTGGLRRAVLDLPAAGVALVATAAIGHWVALAPLALLATVLFLFTATSPWAADATRARDAHDARSDDFIAECIAHIAVLKGAAMEPFFARRMDQLLASGREHEWRRIHASDRAEDLASLVEAATVLAVAALGGVMALSGHMTAGALAASTLLAAGAVRPVVRIAAAAQRAAALGPDSELDEAPVAPVLRPATRPAELQIDAEIPGIALRVKLSASSGTMIALSGPDGALLSRLLRTMAGLEAPTDGAVQFADAPIALYREVHPGAVALVSPRAELMAGTVMENLTLFGRGGTEAEALAACDALGLRPDIDRLPRRLDTIVGEGLAEGLPGALEHRLCLARAIALGPRLLLLEEPQARLDVAADRQLMAGLAGLRGKMTIVLATSRPSYVALADRAFLVGPEGVSALPAVRALRRVGLG